MAPALEQQQAERLREARLEAGEAVSVATTDADEQGTGVPPSSFSSPVPAHGTDARRRSAAAATYIESVFGLVRERMPEWRDSYPGVEDLNLAVMGCIVNGPGESKHADIGISLPGTGEQPAAPVFIDGEKKLTLRGANIAEEFQDLVEDYVKNRYGKSKDQSAAE